ncbi:chemotaxis protein CheY [Cryobacterium roopkundense]|uniref:Chemotaxis protein CheY n=1 Tax=Cryobacterium roopkundense TaxID=1001240 RepID=A0A099JQH9_9MICO|nr:response regulator transcription factor [Cryobacterium roopkundense]KGJ79673.1 chemotaxis protein CheY [Cryobacterium roopkundense]MBB5642516.1 DNA-binding response OmpR family regulator [Cryobacterium roopkundense]
MGTETDERRVAVIIEDDADIRDLLEAVLTQAGFETVPTSNGLDGVRAVREHNPIVTTLDVSMPGIDGFETARRIRSFSTTYLVMLTARSEEIDTLQGLESGADDYLTKPFRPRELRARIDAMLRRPRRNVATETVEEAAAQSAAPIDGSAASADAADQTSDDWIDHNGLRLNSSERLVSLEGSRLELTRTEFDLLATLLESQRRVRSKADLALLLRGDTYSDAYFVNEADKRAVEVHMGNLRRKLGDSITAPRWLETVRGVGYRLAAREKV